MGSGVLASGLMVKAAGQELGHLVSMTDRTVTVFDPANNVIFSLNDGTGHLVGRFQYQAPETEYRYYENSDCSGRSAAQFSDLYNGQYSLGQQAVGQCDSRSYPDGRRIWVFAEGGDNFGLSRGTRAVYVSDIDFTVMATGDGADVCTPSAQGFCVLNHAPAPTVPLNFTTPITIEDN